MLGALATATERIGLGVGIASIYARDAASAHAGARTIAELSGSRFVMGLGVSHLASVAGRGHQYGPPLPAMRDYLVAYHTAPYQAADGTALEPPLVMAALRRRMLELAATDTDGAFPYFVPVEYVARARRIVDEAAERAGRPNRPILVVTAPARLDREPARARHAARRYMDRHLGQPNYLRNLAECGFAEADLARPGSDGLVDALVAWGSASAIVERIEAYRAAGADHVALIPLNADGRQADIETTEAVAAAL
jgi:probable F420-dependent oxidoreductase